VRVELNDGTTPSPTAFVGGAAEERTREGDNIERAGDGVIAFLLPLLRPFEDG